MSALEQVYKPSKWQAEYHACNVRFLLGAGAAGVGKTRALCMDPWQQIITDTKRCENKFHPTANPYPLRWGDSTIWALHLRRELTQLQQTIAWTQRIFPKLDPGADFQTKTNTWRFSCGARFQFGHCKDSNDHEQYLSTEFSHIGYDELVTFEKKQVNMINSRLRSSDPVISHMLKIRAMSNPGASPGSDPHWVRTLFVDPFPSGRKLLGRKLRMDSGEEFVETRMYMPGKLSDNPDANFRRTYEQTLQGLPLNVRMAYLRGDWYFVVGAYFSDVWDPDYHIVDPFKVPRDWKKFRSMDWGYKKPGCIGWYAMDEEDNLWQFDEFYFKGMPDVEVAKRVKEIETRHGLWDKRDDRSRIKGPADTQIWENRGESGKTKYEVFYENGVDWDQADKHPGSRAHHGQRVHKMLGAHAARSEMPSLRFMRHCTNTIRTIPTIMGEEPPKHEEPRKGGDDHAYDQVAYASAYASNGAENVYMNSAEDSAEDEWDAMAPRETSSDYGTVYGIRYR